MLPLKLVSCTALALTLGGCGTLRPGSVQAGECKVFVAPTTQIAGKTPTDQYWVDDTIESGVAACGWHRPAPKKAVKAKPKAKKELPKPKQPEVKQPAPLPPPPVTEPEPPPPVIPPPVVEKPLPWYTRWWIWTRDHFWSTPW